jgi:hypothetical protein
VDAKVVEHMAERAGVILQEVETLDAQQHADVIAAATGNGHDTIALAHRDGVDLAQWAESEDAVLEYDVETGADAATLNECIYCQHEITARQDITPPAVDDHAAWVALAGDHADDCEWIATRAHRINL